MKNKGTPTNRVKFLQNRVEYLEKENKTLTAKISEISNYESNAISKVYKILPETSATYKCH